MFKRNNSSLEVDVETFAREAPAAAAVIDVREPFEYAGGHVPSARLMPLASLAQRAGDLPRAGRVYVICATGNRSLVAAKSLARAGYDAVSVAGGTAAWARSGREIHKGDGSA